MGILPTVDHVQEVAFDQIDIELDARFEEIDELLLETLPNPAAPFLNDIGRNSSLIYFRKFRSKTIKKKLLIFFIKKWVLKVGFLVKISKVLFFQNFKKKVLFL